MKKIISVLKNKYHLIVFTVFALFEGYSLSSASMTGDDYFYAAFVKNGAEYFVSENLRHYAETNGRVFVNLLDEVFLALPLIIWKLFALAVVAATVWLAASVASGGQENEKRFPSALVISCALFAMIDLYILRETVMWITGFFNYVFPVFLVLLYFRAFSRLAEKERGAWYLPLLAFSASLANEQCSVAAVLITLFMLVKTAFVEKSKPRPSCIISLPAALCAMAVLFLAPGNGVRETFYLEFYAKTLAQRFSSNFVPFFSEATATGGMFFFFELLLLCSAFAVIPKIFRKDMPQAKEKKDIFHLAFNVFLLEVSVAAAAVLAIYTFIPGLMRTYAVAVFLLLAVLAIAVGFAVAFLRRTDDGASFILSLCSAAAFLSMLFVPVHGSREFFAPVVLLFVPLIRTVISAFENKFARIFIPFCVTVYASYLFSSRFLAVAAAAYFVFLAELASPKFKKCLPSAVLALCASFTLLFSVGRGYNSNYASNWYNGSAAEIYAEKGDTDEALVLSYPKDAQYSYSLPYTSKYHELMFKRYYGIADDAVIEYCVPEVVGLE